MLLPVSATHSTEPESICSSCGQLIRLSLALVFYLPTSMMLSSGAKLASTLFFAALFSFPHFHTLHGFCRDCRLSHRRGPTLGRMQQPITICRCRHAGAQERCNQQFFVEHHSSHVRLKSKHKIVIHLYRPRMLRQVANEQISRSMTFCEEQ